jgi:hypothetical protein
MKRVNEELLGPYRDDPRQELLVREYCSEIEKVLKSAASRQEALLAVNKACDNFESSCESSVVKTGLRRYLMSLVETTRFPG